MARCQRKKRGSRQGYEERLIDKLFVFLGKLLQWEKCSVAGRANLIIDILLFLIFIFYILSSSSVAIMRIVASIFNKSLTEQTGDNIGTLALIFAVCALACFVIAFIVLLEKKKYKEHFGPDENNEE